MLFEMVSYRQKAQDLSANWCAARERHQGNAVVVGHGSANVGISADERRHRAINSVSLQHFCYQLRHRDAENEMRYIRIRVTNTSHKSNVTSVSPD